MYVRVTILILKSIKRQICFKSKKSILSTIDIKTDRSIRSLQVRNERYMAAYMEGKYRGRNLNQRETWEQPSRSCFVGAQNFRMWCESVLRTVNQMLDVNPPPWQLLARTRTTSIFEAAILSAICGT